MTRPVRPGALRHRLVVECAVLAADESTTWTAGATVFAAITPVSGREVESGGGLAGQVTHRIEIRWRDDLTSRDRLRLGQRIFRVLATRDLDERRARLVIDAEEESR